MSPIILQINLKINVPVSDVEPAWLEAAQPIADTSGLRWKIWIKNDAESEVGGIYLFDDQASIQAFLDGPIVTATKSSPVVSHASVKQFNVMEAHTAITRGPLSIQRGKRTFNQMSGDAFASVPVIKPDELHRRLQREPKPLVIDIQDAADIALTGTIPGAVNISFGSLTYKADHELPEDWRDVRLNDYTRLIVTTCAMGPLGALGGKLLQDMGFTNVYILEGGVQAWIEAGYPVTQPV